MAELSQLLMNLIYTIRNKEYNSIIEKLNLLYEEFIKHSPALDAEKVLQHLENLENKTLHITLDDIQQLNQFASSCEYYAPDAFITTGKLYQIISGLLAYKQLHPKKLADPIISTDNIILFYKFAQEDTVINRSLDLSEKISLCIKYEILKLEIHNQDFSWKKYSKTINILKKFNDKCLLNQVPAIIEQIESLATQANSLLNDFLEYCFTCLPNAIECWSINVCNILEELDEILNQLKNHNESLQLTPQLETNSSQEINLMHNYLQIKILQKSIHYLYLQLAPKPTSVNNYKLLLNKTNFIYSINALHKSINKIFINLKTLNHHLTKTNFILWHPKNTILTTLQERFKKINLDMGIHVAYKENQSLCLELNI